MIEIKEVTSFTPDDFVPRKKIHMIMNVEEYQDLIMLEGREKAEKILCEKFMKAMSGWMYE